MQPKMSRNNIYIFFFFFVVTTISAQDLPTFFTKSDSFFNSYVVDGRVKYAAIKNNPQQLNDILKSAKDISVATSDTEIYQAFWINVYNLLVIDGVVENYPLKSPLDIAGFFDSIEHNIGGEVTTLNGIENNLLRAEFPNEPRFHFVLVCAGLGCPPIIDEAYRPSTLDTQLQQQTSKALNHPEFIRVDGSEVRISQIFEWYKSDFERAGGIVTFINEFRNSKLSYDVRVGYYPYDWSLNSAR
jgi:hypothetical protein